MKLTSASDGARRRLCAKDGMRLLTPLGTTRYGGRLCAKWPSSSLRCPQDRFVLFIEPRGAVEPYETPRDRMTTVLMERGGRLCAKDVMRLLTPLEILRYGGRLCVK